MSVGQNVTPRLARIDTDLMERKKTREGAKDSK